MRDLDRMLRCLPKAAINLAVVLGGLLHSSPALAAFWEHTNGPPAGHVTGIALDPAGHVYAAGYGGVFRSKTGSTSWQPLSQGLWDSIVNSVVTDSRGQVLAGTRSGVFRFSLPTESWERVSDGLTSTWVRKLVRGDDGRVYATTTGGIFRTDAGGDAWTALPGPFTGALMFASASPGGDLFVGTTQGLYRSIDDSLSWVAVNAGLQSTDTRAICFMPNGTILLGTSRGDAVYRSMDNGDTWQAASNLPSYAQGSVLVPAPNGDIYLGGWPGFFRSRDGGASWTLYSAGLTNSAFHDMVLTASGSIYSATEGGVHFSSTGGESWSERNSGLVNSTPTSLAVHPDGSLFAGTEGATWRSLDRGDSWTRVFNSPTNLVAVDPTGRIYTSVAGGGLMRSADHGQTWKAINNGLPPGVPGILEALIFADGMLFAASPQGLFRSQDDSASWSLVLNANLYTVAASPAGTLLAAVWDASDRRIYRSEDGGDTWTPSDTGVSGGSNAVSSFSFSPGGRIFAAKRLAGVYTSDDDGETWAHIPDASITPWDELHVGADGTIFVATPAGVYVSLDDGQSWIRTVASAEDGFFGWALAESLVDGTIYVSASGQGVFRDAGLFCSEPSDDDDGDLICETIDNCPGIVNSSQTDRDDDGLGDVCDGCPDDQDNDIDGDGICGDRDNCPFVQNPNQKDSDHDGVGSACEPPSTQLLPVDGEILYPDSPVPTFSWEPGEMTLFTIEWSSTPAFEGAVRSSGNIPVPGDSFTPDTALWSKILKTGIKSGVIFWRLTGSDGAGSEELSGPRALVIAPASAPVLLAPGGGAVLGASAAPLLTWDPKHNSAFRVLFSSNPAFKGKPKASSGKGFNLTGGTWQIPDVTWSKVVNKIATKSADGRVYIAILARDAKNRRTISDAAEIVIQP